jgi:trk system potassium uptake protein TrkA
MNVVIIGGGRIGSYLATLLLELGHEVRLIEDRLEVIEKLHKELPTECIRVGDPIDQLVLEDAGLDNADVFVAATANDGTNLAAALLVKKMFAVPRVIGRVNNPRYAWLYTPDMGVDVALNQTDILARLIEEEMSLGDMIPLLKLRRGKYSLVEEKVPSGAVAVGRTIQELDLPAACSIAAIIRAGEVVVPRGSTVIEVEDEILAIVDREGADKLSALFTPA